MIFSKKAQLDVSFNWIYILIAGAVILLFFTGIIVRQKAASEKQLSTEVVRIMESIFTAAGVSEKTKNSIDTSGLAEYTLTFSCAEGVGEYGIRDGSMVQNAIEPIFSPAELQGSRLSLWSLPYKLPFKILDFLFVTSENTKYYLLGSDPFITEFINETAADEKIHFRISAERIAGPEQMERGNYFQVRVVDFTAAVREGAEVPNRLQEMDDGKVTAVAFTGNQVDYYQKEGAAWKKTTPAPLPIISLGGERDAAKYAAIFSGSDQIYQCNMQKAFRRLKLLNEVYGGAAINLREPGGKLGEMLQYYGQHPQLAPSPPDCVGKLRNYPENILSALTTHQNQASACLLWASSCADLIASAALVRKLNEQLRADCLTLY